MEIENWRELIKSGDITDASKIVGCSRDYYARSLKINPAEWSPPMVAINREVKRIICERETSRAEFIKEAEAC